MSDALDAHDVVDTLDTLDTLTLSPARDAPALATDMSAGEAPTPTRKRSWGMLTPLGVRDYRLLFTGQMISAVGDAFYAVALPWYMLSQGGGAANLGLVLTAYGATMGGMTLVGGWLTDRIHARPVMLASDFARVFVVGALAWATFGAHAPLGWIAALTAALGVFDGMFMPASNAIAPDLLPESQLGAANGLNYAMARTAQMLGPSLAGYVVAHYDTSIAFAVDAATFVVSTLTLLFIRKRVAAPSIVTDTSAVVTTAAEPTPGNSDAGEPASANIGLWRFARTTPYFLVLLLVLIIANLLNGAVGEVAIPAMAHGPLRSSAQGYGFIVAAFGAGGLLGGLLASALGKRISRGVYSLGFFALQSVVILALAFSVNTAMATGLMGAFGVLNGLGNVSFMTVLQSRLPRHLLGRIMGVFAFCNFATLPLSVAAGGFATARYGPQMVIIVGAGVLLGSMVIALLNRDTRTL